MPHRAAKKCYGPAKTDGRVAMTDGMASCLPSPRNPSPLNHNGCNPWWPREQVGEGTLECSSYNPHLHILDHAPHEAAAIPVMCQLSGVIIIGSPHHQPVLSARLRRPSISPSPE